MTYDLWINYTRVPLTVGESSNPAALVERAKREYGRNGVRHAAVYTADGELVIELDA